MNSKHNLNLLSSVIYTLNGFPAFSSLSCAIEITSIESVYMSMSAALLKKDEFFLRRQNEKNINAEKLKANTSWVYIFFRVDDTFILVGSKTLYCRRAVALTLAVNALIKALARESPLDILLFHSYFIADFIIV